ncbi:MAG: ornithine cyclodeaminase family protein [Peptoniphilus sp.]|nr:ornithine cyclodeaminase family protein [Peptoniphilus sp.]MDD7363148.1 ornithine cyclodeaminase family protein [Bacillota bacterium]MDY6044528.1 ornithine cyclodeaminase family protein [Peptoniphilus sp.]
MKVLILTAEEVQQSMNVRDVIEADKSAMGYFTGGKTTIPLRTNIDVQKAGGQALFMPGVIEGEDALGVKIIAVYPKNAEKGLPAVPATMVLMDVETGFVKGIMDGTELTRMRTGALSGAATDLLAKEDAEVFVLIGTGGQAKSQLESVLAVRPIKKAYIFNRKQDKADAFVDAVKEDMSEYGAELIGISSLEEVLPEADVITTVTTATSPVFDGSLVKPGCHVNGVGAYTPEMIELPPEIIERADKVYLDTIDGVMNEAGDLMKPVEDGVVERAKVEHEIGEVVLGNLPGRESDEEITLFKSTGSAVFDIVVAEKVYRMAREKGIGREIEL